MQILDSIKQPSQIKALNSAELARLCAELRQFMLLHISAHGGHLASNLGVIELTVALLKRFDPPKDKLIWDVGHQAYAYKILTQRRDQFASIRQFGGLAPFPKRSESIYDAFGTGHSSTSIAALLGMYLAAPNQAAYVAIIGDGGLGAGMAFEALNHAGAIQADLLVILNDNQMSIDANVGNLHANNSAIKQFATALGFSYNFCENGNDIEQLLQSLKQISQHSGPRFLHIMTQKGSGYAPAELDPITFHGVSKFDLATGKVPPPTDASFSSYLGAQLLTELDNSNNLFVISPAMLLGSGLAECARAHPQRVIDVGIAEQHAVTLAAGISCSGNKVVVAIYSTFLQRAVDQVIHDVAIQNLAVIFAVDRAGLVGPDGVTHHGYYDIVLLHSLPNFIVMAPADARDCQQMLQLALTLNAPCALRYPRAVAKLLPSCKLELGRARVLCKGHNLAILVFGSLVVDLIPSAQKINATLVDMRFIKPLDTALLQELCSEHRLFVTIEEGAILGGIGKEVGYALRGFSNNVRVLNLGLDDQFYQHGSREELLQQAKLDTASISAQILAFVANATND